MSHSRWFGWSTMSHGYQGCPNGWVHRDIGWLVCCKCGRSRVNQTKGLVLAKRWQVRGCALEWLGRVGWVWILDDRAILRKEVWWWWMIGVKADDGKWRYSLLFQTFRGEGLFGRDRGSRGGWWIYLTTTYSFLAFVFYHTLLNLF